MRQPASLFCRPGPIRACADLSLQLHRVRDPFGTLIARGKGGVVINEQPIINTAAGMAL